MLLGWKWRHFGQNLVKRWIQFVIKSNFVIQYSQICCPNSKANIKIFGLIYFNWIIHPGLMVTLYSKWLKSKCLKSEYKGFYTFGEEIGWITNEFSSNEHKLIHLNNNPLKNKISRMRQNLKIDGQWPCTLKVSDYFANKPYRPLKYYLNLT